MAETDDPVREYRKAYQAELAQRAGKPASKTRQLLTEPDLASNVAKLLATLRDQRAPPDARRDALHALQTMNFLGPRFAPYRPDFLGALREIARPETDAQLREDSLETLAIERDSQAQELLRRGLADPKAALVSAAKALQFLAYDDHAEAADLARDAFHKAADDITKEQALRLLASDPGSAGLFTSLLRDKSQPRNIRAVSAAGLNVLDPMAFAAVGRAIVTDDKDYEDIRATVLNTLTQSPDHQHLRHDPDFAKRVEQFAAGGPLKSLSAVATRFMKLPEK
jgi:hypothetical protein